ncbi:MAG: ABC transporter ATP-binding protein [Dehalococcoidales bacterium]|nr:ABC transporter ATP-binding protein [Dehalococcoidales bacterium]
MRSIEHQDPTMTNQMAGEMAVLEIDSLVRRFGGLAALRQVSFAVNAHEVLGIIGPNGAGKTTLINVIGGIYPPTSGRILFQGRDITELPAHLRCRLGIARTFQIVRPVQGLNLLQNIMVGSLFGRGASLKEARARALGICQFMGLSRVDRAIAKLTVLEIKKMEIARALSTQPRILLLDEVMAGLNVDETREMIDLVRQVCAQGVTVCIIEHVMSVIRELTERVIVLDHGEKIAQGPYEEVSRDPRVIGAYLGEEE